MFFYNMARFLLIVATTGIGCRLIWLYSDRPALRRTAADRIGMFFTIHASNDAQARQLVDMCCRKQHA